MYKIIFRRDGQQLRCATGIHVVTLFLGGVLFAVNPCQAVEPPLGFSIKGLSVDMPLVEALKLEPSLRCNSWVIPPDSQRCVSTSGISLTVGGGRVTHINVIAGQEGKVRSISLNLECGILKENFVASLKAKFGQPIPHQANPDWEARAGQYEWKLHGQEMRVSVGVEKVFSCPTISIFSAAAIKEYTVSKEPLISKDF
jgi:hypothetical protein